MRTKNSIKNISVGIISQIIIVLLGFISRKVFLDSLGSEYLGVNGLLTSVLSMLGLIESGIGTSIVYNLYKPLAEDDRPKVISLIQLYKKSYIIISIIVSVLSMLLYPIVIKTMRPDNNIGNITIIYGIFVFKNIISYLFAYKFCIINADQKSYILSKISIVFNIISMLMKIWILKITENYVLFLTIELILMLIQNIYTSIVVNRLYPYLKNRSTEPLDENIKSNIRKNVKAIFLHNIGSYCVFSTDNLLISAFQNISLVGLVSTYNMIISQLVGLIYPIIGGIDHSIGNLIASEDEDKRYSIFKVTYLVNFWIYSVCIIFLYNLLEPFICWWIGSEYLLDKFTFIIILLNTYITGLRGSIASFKNKAGIFTVDKYAALIEAVINLTTSVVLVKLIGLTGIFLGTTISTLSVVFWNVPRIVYKYVFKKSSIEYFKKYIFYIFLTICMCVLTNNICGVLSTNNTLLSLIARGIICITIPNIVYLAIFYKSEEFKYILSIFNNVFKSNSKLRLKKLEG